MSISVFHPIVANWFAGAFAAPTPAQAWPAIAAGCNVLIAAPTGSGKTLAAFLASIDKLLRQGLAGEQYALPEAVGKLREVRRAEPKGEFVSLSGIDPLNLVGILTPGAKLAAVIGNRVLYRDGVPVAVLAGGEVRPLEEMDAGTLWQA